MSKDLELKLKDFKPIFGFMDYTRRFVNSGKKETEEILKKRDFLIAYNQIIVGSVPFGVYLSMLGC